MITLLALLLSAATPADAPADDEAQIEAADDAQVAGSSADTKSEGRTGWKCSTGRNRLQSQEAKEDWDKLKAIEEGKVNRQGLPKEARDILDRLTMDLEKEGDRDASDAAEFMREFGGARAPRSTAC
jgi:uncharacterized low-complexity protein